MNQRSQSKASKVWGQFSALGQFQARLRSWRRPRGLGSNASEPECCEISCDSGRVAKVRIVRPKVNNPEVRLPVVVFFSWTWRRRNTTSDQERFIREFAAGAQVAVVCVDQDHPAEHLLPLAVDEAYDATKWVASHGESLNLDTSKLGVAAEDSGCAVITGVRSLAETRRFPAILFQVLF